MTINFLSKSIVETRHLYMYTNPTPPRWLCWLGL